MQNINKWMRKFFFKKTPKKSNKFFMIVPKEVTPLDLRFVDLDDSK